MAKKNDFLTLEDILENSVDDLKKRQAKRRWGEWTYNPRPYTLTHTKTGYKVLLADVGSSAQMLDWIFHLLHKEWATPTVIHDFIQALDDLLDPQANYCSQGVEKHATPKLLLKLRRRQQE